MVSVDDSIDDGTECDNNCVEHRDSDTHGAKDAVLDDYCCTETDAADNCFH
jgi:hypothetical protein